MAPGFTLLVLYQGADFELDETQSILERVSKSLTWDTSSEARVVDVLDFFELASDTDAETEEDASATDASTGGTAESEE